ncbi:hypothetical protein BJ170DRAFT_685536 [Xylariales sp. AK1849]|nr:hypothetical protein BJ170DRAFT_685536 [Xylariales sp. AK1849]
MLKVIWIRELHKHKVSTIKNIDYERQLNSCPTYHKQQSSLRNRIFGTYRGDKSCGKVRRLVHTSINNCDHCAIKFDGLTTRRVGNGATIVQRQFVDESFRKERHNDARYALKKSEKMSRSKSNKHYEIISCKNSVWCPDYYHHPEAVAEATYGRGSAPAPPVVPLRVEQKLVVPRDQSHNSSPCKTLSQKPTSRKLSKQGDKTKIREGYLTKGWEESSKHPAPGVLSVVPDRSPAFGLAHVEPLRRPSEPAPTLKLTGLRNQGPAGPSPSVETPRLPPQARPNGGFVRGDYKTSLPVAGQRTQQPIRPRPRVPKPLYLVYLDEQNGIPARSLPLPRKPAPIPVKEPRRTALQNFGMAIGIEPMSPTDTSSDISFACGDARQVERKVPEQS